MEEFDFGKYALFLEQETGIDFENLAALYLIIGDDLLFILNLLAGKNIKIPSKRTLTSVLNKMERGFIFELKNKTINTQRGWVQSKDLETDDLIKLDGVEYIVLKKPTIILGHRYVMLNKVLEENS